MSVAILFTTVMVCAAFPVKRDDVVFFNNKRLFLQIARLLRFNFLIIIVTVCFNLSKLSDTSKFNSTGLITITYFPGQYAKRLNNLLYKLFLVH